MKIKLNDDEIELDDGATVNDLFVHLGVKATGFVVAVESAVIPRSEFDSFVLVEAATVEMMVLYAGG